MPVKLLNVPRSLISHTSPFRLIWTLFFIFTSLHLFANYRAVTCVAMETFNQTRLHSVVQFYLSSPDGSVLQVKDANRKEPVIWSKKTIIYVQIDNISFFIFSAHLAINDNVSSDITFEFIITNLQLYNCR